MTPQTPVEPEKGATSSGQVLFGRIRLPGEQERQALRDALPGVQVVFARLSWLLVGGLVGLLLGGAATLLRPPLYASTAYLSVTSSTPQEAAAAARAAQAFARIATAPSVVSGPLSAAGLDDAAVNPRARINAQAAPDAPLFSVSGVNSDPERAQRIASVAAASLTQVSSLGPFRAVVVARPTTASVPITPRWLAPFGAALTGVGLALVFATTVPTRFRPRAG
jgi:capsular polysaccharide biosynthesis protein